MAKQRQPESPFLPDKISEDWIGPPDPISKLRPVRQYVPENETIIEKMLRVNQASVLEWNHTYWKQHNKSFKKERRRFVEQQATSDVSDDQMAVFYRDFMERHREKHRRYNLQWYRRNVHLLGLAALVAPVRLLRRFRVLR